MLLAICSSSVSPASLTYDTESMAIRSMAVRILYTFVVTPLSTRSPMSIIRLIPDTSCW